MFRQMEFRLEGEMKTVLKILGVILAVVVVLALLGGAAMFIFSRLEFGRIVLRSGRFGFPFIGPLLMIWLVGAVMLIAAILFILWFVPRAEGQTVVNETPVVANPTPPMPRAEGQTVVNETPVVANPTPPMPRPTIGSTPLDLLKIRYAKGEISKDQFDQMKQEIA